MESNQFSRRPLDELKVSDEQRELLRKIFFVKPVPFVKRVVFISTPHHGSYVAAFSVAQLIARLVRLPTLVLGTMGNVLQGNSDAILVNPKRIGAVYGMTPGSPLARILPSIPVGPGIEAHSIIAVEGDGPVEDGGDGVVKYKSAHIDGVESEFIVRSPHSCQANPATIGEVRRILLEHLAQACTDGIDCTRPAPPSSSPRQPS